MNTIRALLIIVNLCLVNSCSKEQEEELKFNFGNYNSVGDELGEIRLFTKDGEIFNQQLIKAYIERKELNFITEKDNPEKLENIRIEFLTENTVNFITPEKSETRNIIYKENVIYFEQENISDGLISVDLNIDDFTLYSPLYYFEEDIISTSVGDAVPITYKHCAFGQYSKSQIIIPSLYISLSRNQKKSKVENSDSDYYILGGGTYPYEISSSFIGGLLNDFDKSKISLLLNNEYYVDTLAVQNRNFVLKR